MLHPCTVGPARSGARSGMDPRITPLLRSLGSAHDQVMEYQTQVVPAKDLALLQAAIGLGGGTITHSKPHDNGDVAVTYVVDYPSRVAIYH